MNPIDISDLDKADVLVALFNHPLPDFPGGMRNPANLTRAMNPQPMDRTEALALLEQTTYFDYVRGRVMKVDLSGDELNPALYDRDTGEGAAAVALEALRIGQIQDGA